VGYCWFASEYIVRSAAIRRQEKGFLPGGNSKFTWQGGSFSQRRMEVRRLGRRKEVLRRVPRRRNSVVTSALVGTRKDRGPNHDQEKDGHRGGG